MGEGREARKGGAVCIIKTDSHRCAAETNPTLQSNYPPVKRKKEFCSSKFQFPGPASHWAALVWSVFEVKHRRQRTRPEIRSHSTHVVALLSFHLWRKHHDKAPMKPSIITSRISAYYAS